MPQAQSLARELISFFRQSRRRTWTKDQIILAVHEIYIKQLEEDPPASSLPAQPEPDAKSKGR